MTLPIDIRIAWDPANGRGDWVLDGAILDSDKSLESAVLVSLFSDRVADPADPLPPGDADRRGWYGDDQGDPLTGSRLWLLARAKHVPETAARARDYILESLQWLVDDGVVARVDCATWWAAANQLAAQVILNKPDGTALTMNFADLWSDL